MSALQARRRILSASTGGNHDQEFAENGVVVCCHRGIEHACGRRRAGAGARGCALQHGLAVPWHTAAVLRAMRRRPLRVSALGLRAAPLRGADLHGKPRRAQSVAKIPQPRRNIQHPNLLDGGQARSAARHASSWNVSLQADPREIRGATYDIFQLGKQTYHDNSFHDGRGKRGGGTVLE